MSSQQLPQERRPARAAERAHATAQAPGAPIGAASGGDERDSSDNAAPHVETADDSQNSSFAHRLKYLFETTTRRDGSRWTFNGVARATQGRLSTQQVYALYNGQSANPTLETIRTLAEVFAVEPDFFVRVDAFAEHQQRLVDAYAALEADPRIAFVSRHMGQMSDADKALIADFVKRLVRHPALEERAPSSATERTGE